MLACQSMKSMPKERLSLADMRPMDFMQLSRPVGSLLATLGRSTFPPGPPGPAGAVQTVLTCTRILRACAERGLFAASAT